MWAGLYQKGSITSTDCLHRAQPGAGDSVVTEAALGPGVTDLPAQWGRQTVNNLFLVVSPVNFLMFVSLVYFLPLSLFSFC